MGSARQARIACEIPLPCISFKWLFGKAKPRQANGKTPVVKGGGRRVMWSSRAFCGLVHMSRRPPPCPSGSTETLVAQAGICRRGAGGRASPGPRGASQRPFDQVEGRQPASCLFCGWLRLQSLQLARQPGRIGKRLFRLVSGFFGRCPLQLQQGG